VADRRASGLDGAHGRPGRLTDVPLTAVARAVARDVGGRTTFSTLRSQVPLSLRATDGGLTVVASAFGPLGGDRTRLEVVVEPGARLRVGSAGAQVAQPGATDAVSRAEVHLEVGERAVLHWQPQPLVVSTGAEHRLDLQLRTTASATVVLAETVVLGRTAEAPGRARARWRVSCDDEPLLAADLDVGAGAPRGWDGPAVTGGARVLVTALVTGPVLPADGPLPGGGEVLRLAGPGVLLSWLGHDTVAAARALRAFLDRVPAEAATPVR
jgi:urease accessory protein